MLRERKQQTDKSNENSIQSDKTDANKVNEGQLNIVQLQPVQSVTSKIWTTIWTLWLISLALGFTQYKILWIPIPLSYDAASQEFSEARALKHVEILSKQIQHRQVSMPGLIQAAVYIRQQLFEIEQLARNNSGWEAKIVEHKVSGASNLIFFHHNITNAYANLTVLGILLIPPGINQQENVLLVNAHFDAPIGSPGASDCASCVGTSLELARKFASSPPDGIMVPVFFLFNGGEETFSQAAHGFMQLYNPNKQNLVSNNQFQRKLQSSQSYSIDSDYYLKPQSEQYSQQQSTRNILEAEQSSQQNKDTQKSDLNSSEYNKEFGMNFGAFINIESTGPGGAPVMFQHVGAWTAKAYMSSAIAPRATNVAQDFFEAGIIPADTDMRMFSYQSYGWLPGVDIAFFRDAAAYHTDRDTLERIRKGSLQELGQTLSALIPEMSVRISNGEADKSKFQSKRSYFLNLPLYVVCLEYSEAFYFVMFPGFVWILLVFFTFLSKNSNNYLFNLFDKKTIKQSVYAIGPINKSIFSALFLSIFVAILVGGLGFPMTWFSRKWLGITLYITAAIIGLFLPLVNQQWKINFADGAGGVAILLSVIIVPLMTFSGQMGLAIIPAMWAFVLTPAALLFLNNSNLPQQNSIIFTTCLYFIPLLSASFAGLGLMPHVMEKISMSGQDLLGPCHPEIIVAVIVTAQVFQCGLGFIPMWLTLVGFGEGGGIRVSRLLKFLAAILVCSLVLSMTVFQNGYTDEQPKRIFIFYANKINSSQPPQIEEQKLVVGTLDGYKTEWVPGIQSRPGRITLEGWELLPLFPIQQIFEGVGFKVSQPLNFSDLVSHPPYINLVSQTYHFSKEKNYIKYAQVNLEIVSERPGWGVLNITGDIKQWSFGEVVSIDTYKQQQFHLVRFASGTMEPFRWPFWLMVEQGAKIRVEFSVLYLPLTEELKGEVERIPSWTAVSFGTAFFGASEYDLKNMD